MPDVALRLWGTRIVGSQDLDLGAAGADALVSKSFGVAGMMKLQPYATFGLAMVNALSAVVGFKHRLQDFEFVVIGGHKNGGRRTALQGHFGNSASTRPCW